VANALAYYDTATITAIKSFIVQAPGRSFTFKISTNLKEKHSSLFWRTSSDELNKAEAIFFFEASEKLFGRKGGG
jgi:hypothetical protein